jgi:hypothetical protein
VSAFWPALDAWLLRKYIPDYRPACKNADCRFPPACDDVTYLLIVGTYSSFTEG